MEVSGDGKSVFEFSSTIILDLQEQHDLKDLPLNEGLVEKNNTFVSRTGNLILIYSLKLTLKNQPLLFYRSLSVIHYC
jgi:hypothetical protein